MARLFEFQSKDVLAESGVTVPEGKVCSTPDEVRDFVNELGRAVVLKTQVWFTGRAAVGGIKFAENADDAYDISGEMFGKIFNKFKVDQVLVEEKINIKKEMFASLIIDDRSRSQVLVFSEKGGSGIEEIAEKHPESIVKLALEVKTGIRNFEAFDMMRKLDLDSSQMSKIARILVKIVDAANKNEARALEINPLVITDEGEIVAVDARITIDDYAVFRHPELGIRYAREIDNPPSKLDLIAYDVEKNDYRGTFYFIQLEREISKNEKYIGFHGAGGGGSMMSMDAVRKKGFKLANFCDTSGNPPASKVYRAAKIILSQEGICGYFGSGSGVASQEQVHSARGLAKAFLEEGLNIPAVIRLGGNMEEKAVELLKSYTKELPAIVEGYTKDETADFCAERVSELIIKSSKIDKKPAGNKINKFDYSFETLTGMIKFDHDKCVTCESKVCVKECIPQILKIENEKPVLAITNLEAKKGKCIECLACELECMLNGEKGCEIELPIPGL